MSVNIDIKDIEVGDTVRFWRPRSIGVLQWGTVVKVGYKYLYLRPHGWPQWITWRINPSEVTEHVPVTTNEEQS